MMMKNLRQDTEGEKKVAKRSVLGLLFKPQLGPTIRPLRESTRIFVHLVASVFAIYKLIPKDYPGLRDPETRISLFQVIHTAWKNVHFTREGAPQVILFFAVVGVMGFGAIIAISALLSLFVGHAHAAAFDSSNFGPEGANDIAQSWLDYLFKGTAMTAYTNQGNAVPAALGIQSALTKVLAFYSDAILVIAAMVLFYHLAAMIVETAHHGQVMGKRASQIWAPIRLVVAIGLLVPINGGLNCG